MSAISNRKSLIISLLLKLDRWTLLPVARRQPTMTLSRCDQRTCPEHLRKRTDPILFARNEHCAHPKPTVKVHKILKP